MNFYGFGITALIITIWRVFVLANNGVGLSFDEAQYWLWSLSPDWGYYSKPPIVAWAIGLTRAACGDTPACVRIGSPLAYFIGSFFIFWLVRKMFEERTACVAGVVFLTLPAVSFSSMLVTTDPFLLMFWALGMFAAWQAITSGQRLWWVLLGCAFGFGMLAKYAMVLFLLSFLLFLIASPEYRKHIFSRELSLSLALGFVIYSPNLIWNITHGFASYRHTKANANLGGELFHPHKALEFIGSQLGVFGPILFLVLVWCLFNWKKLVLKANYRFFLCFIGPLLLIMVSQSFLSRANANWAAPIYVAGAALVSAYLLERGKIWLLGLSLALHLLGAGILYNLDNSLKLVGVELNSQTDITKRLKGWDKVGGAVGYHLQANSEAIMLADERKLMANLIYYVNPHPFNAIKWNPSGQINDTFDMNTRMRGNEGKDFVFVTEVKNADHVSKSFASVTLLEEVTIPIYPDYKREVRIYLAKDFKGYAEP